jgi:glycosyltransferase involved in cell wall biosynthesis
MRIALVHSFYRSDTPSGENVVVIRQAEALRRAGHDVLLVSRHTDDEMKTRLHGLQSAFRVATGRGPDPSHELGLFKPDVVHVHNLFPNFGERWLESWESPIVATLHNFRPLCANALLFRDGVTCTECIKGNSLPAIGHACYRDSRVKTLPIAIHNAFGLRRNRLIQRADRLIALSERSRRVFADCGGQTVAKKLCVIPNGIEDTSSGDGPPPQHWTYVGRLSPEKGVWELVNAWPKQESLRVAGDGPGFEQIRALGNPGVELLGVISPAEVDELLRHSWGLVFPSRWMEGFPTVLAEAAMHGTPILAREGSSGADFVARTGSGLVFKDDVELIATLREFRERHGELAASSRQAFENELTCSGWVTRLEELYVSSRSQFAQR